MEIREEDVLKNTQTANFFNYAGFYDAIAAMDDMRVLVEVGVWKGHSITHLAQKLIERGGTFELYAVDLWEKSQDTDLMKNYADQIPLVYEIYNHNLHAAGVRTSIFDLQGDSAKSAEFFDDDKIDFCFIDAAHDFDPVVNDLMAWYPKVRKGGIIAGHDIHHESVKLALLEVFGSQQITVDEHFDVWYFTKEED